jgi:hypothetical protein
VCNLLNNDLYEREKMAYQMANARDNRSNHRFNAKHLLLIRQELGKPSDMRNTELLDSMFSHLKFFKEKA